MNPQSLGLPAAPQRGSMATAPLPLCVQMGGAGMSRPDGDKSSMVLLTALGLVLPAGTAALAFGVVMGALTPKLPGNPPLRLRGLSPPARAWAAPYSPGDAGPDRRRGAVGRYGLPERSAHLRADGTSVRGGKTRDAGWRGVLLPPDRQLSQRVAGRRVPGLQRLYAGLAGGRPVERFRGCLQLQDPG